MPQIRKCRCVAELGGESDTWVPQPNPSSSDVLCPPALRLSQGPSAQGGAGAAPSGHTRGHLHSCQADP